MVPSWAEMGQTDRAPADRRRPRPRPADPLVLARSWAIKRCGVPIPSLVAAELEALAYFRELGRRR